jgi:hypothetical protein
MLVAEIQMHISGVLRQPARTAFVIPVCTGGSTFAMIGCDTGASRRFGVSRLQSCCGGSLMYAGHIAIGLLIKAYAPRVRALPIIVGSGVLDIMDGLLAMAGINHITPDPQAGPYLFFDLNFVDWDHSLLMAILISLCWGALFIRQREVAMLAALACFSHWLSDVPVHNSDLALYPGSAEHFGWGAWGKLGILSWFLEGAFVAALTAWSWRLFARRGVAFMWPAIVMAVLVFQLSPWLSPMRFVASLPQSEAQFLYGLLTCAGFVGPTLLLSWLIDRAEARAVPAQG